MIEWNLIKYDYDQANRDFQNIKIERKGFTSLNLSGEFNNLRSKMIAARNKIYDDYNYDQANNLDYRFDLLFGLELYEILNEEGISHRNATGDDVWRYLSICVVPDIVHSRWGLNADRFFANSRRIWLKTLWWYIELSWRNNKEETYNILCNDTTDTLVSLVERPGLGYNILLYREIMYQLDRYCKDHVLSTRRDMMRGVMKVNTAKVLTVSPELSKNGIEGYVKDLFRIVGEK